jgi:hypothetical protein
MSNDVSINITSTTNSTNTDVTTDLTTEIATCVVYSYSIDQTQGSIQPHEQYDRVLVPETLWRSFNQHDSESSNVLLVSIDNPLTNTSIILTVGGYHNINSAAEPLFLCPQWVFLHIDEASITTYRRLTEMPPVTMKITLKPLDNELYHANLEEEISDYLSNWQVIKAGTTITVPIKELGGFPVDIYVESMEPDTIGLLRGDLILDLAAPMEDVVEWSTTNTNTNTNTNTTHTRPESTEMPAKPAKRPALEEDCTYEEFQQLEQFQERENEMFPQHQPQHQPHLENQRQPTQHSGFVPFSGIGNRLGSR